MKECYYSVIVSFFIQFAASFIISIGIVYASTFFAYSQPGEHQTMSGYMYVFPYQVWATVSVTIAVSNSLIHVFQHHNIATNSEDIRTCTTIILLVVPVYGFCSAAAFITEHQSAEIAMIFDAVREFYEALVLIAFIQFIAEYWGSAKSLAAELDDEEITLGTVTPHGVRHLVENLKICGYEVKSLSPFGFRRAPGSDFVAKSFTGILQYAAVMVIVLLANMCIWCYGPDKPEMETVKGVLKFVKLASNIWALNNLLVLYEYMCESKDTKERMAKIKPLSKFLCIKLIVMFSLWQENICEQLAKRQLLPAMMGWNELWTDEEKNADALVNFLVCMEMLLFAQWHRYAYPHDEELVAQGDDEDAGVGIMKLYSDIQTLRSKANSQKQAIKVLKRDRKRAYATIGELQRAFNTFDLDKSQECSIAQLQYLMGQAGITSEQKAKDMLLRADTDRSGRLSFEEFSAVVQGEIKFRA